MEHETPLIAAGMGILFFITGLIAGRKQKSWSELTQTEKRFRIALIAIASILVLLGIVAFLLVD